MTERIKKCDGDYPDLDFEKDFLNSDRTPIVPEGCAGCDYMYTCKMRVTLLINLGIEIDDDGLDEIKILTEEEKSKPQILQ